MKSNILILAVSISLLTVGACKKKVSSEANTTPATSASQSGTSTIRPAGTSGNQNSTGTIRPATSASQSGTSTIRPAGTSGNQNSTGTSGNQNSTGTSIPAGTSGNQNSTGTSGNQNSTGTSIPAGTSGNQSPDNKDREIIDLSASQGQNGEDRTNGGDDDGKDQAITPERPLNGSQAVGGVSAAPVEKEERGSGN